MSMNLCLYSQQACKSWEKGNSPKDNMGCYQVKMEVMMGSQKSSIHQTSLILKDLGVMLKYIITTPTMALCWKQ